MSEAGDVCSNSNDSSFFFWSPEEAISEQVEQIGVSACGATGVINVLSVLGLPHSPEDVSQHVSTRLRAEDAPVPDYLHSRSVAGATHKDLIDGLCRSTSSKVFSRFFSFYPRREINLSQWLSGWMRQGAVPLATINLQRVVPSGYQVPDAWHHQMIYGIDDTKVYMCNPLVAETTDKIMEQLCSPSVLLIRRADIMSRLTSDVDLRKIEAHPDVRWKEMKVLDQVHNVIDEEMAVPLPNSQMFRLMKQWLFTSHIEIPAAYQSGITLCVRKDNEEVCDKLCNASELPILSSGEEAGECSVQQGESQDT